MNDHEIKNLKRHVKDATRSTLEASRALPWVTYPMHGEWNYSGELKHFRIRESVQKITHALIEIEYVLEKILRDLE